MAFTLLVRVTESPNLQDHAPQALLSLSLPIQSGHIPHKQRGETEITFQVPNPTLPDVLGQPLALRFKGGGHVQGPPAEDPGPPTARAQGTQFLMYPIQLSDLPKL